jgi:hypothetical protein
MTKAEILRKVFYWVSFRENTYYELGSLFNIRSYDPGIPDLFLPVKKHHFAGLFVCFSLNPSKTPNEDQARWIERLTNQGYAVRVCSTSDEVIEVIETYFNKFVYMSAQEDMTLEEKHGEEPEVEDRGFSIDTESDYADELSRYEG